jgi:hypothetical protein
MCAVRARSARVRTDDLRPGGGAGSVVSLPRHRTSEACGYPPPVRAQPQVAIPNAGCARNPRGQRSDVRGQSKPLHMIAACDHLGCARV